MFERIAFVNKKLPALNADALNAIQDFIAGAYQDTVHEATAADKTPLAVLGFVGQTANLVSVKDAGGAVLFSVAPDSKTSIGSGDQLSIGGVQVTSAQRLAIRKGTAGAPDTSPHPLVKVERSVTIDESVLGGLSDGSEIMPAASFQTSAIGNSIQPIGSYSGAKSAAVTGLFDDACGSYHVGLTYGSGTGIGIGLFAIGMTTSAAVSSGSVALDVSSFNSSGTNRVFNTTGETAASGLHITATGNNNSGAAIQIGKPSASFKTFEVGIGVPNNNPITGALIQDEGNSARSIWIKGTHATAAIAVAAGAGGVAIGEGNIAVAGSLLEIKAPTGTTTNLLNIWAGGATDAFTIRMSNGSGSADLALSGSVDAFMTGTAAGDVALKTNGGALHLGGSVSTVKVTSGNALSFFNNAAVTKRTGWAAATGTATRTTFNTATVTLVQLAEHVKALIDDLMPTTGYGLLNP